MLTRHRWATFVVESAELAPAFLPGDVLHFDPSRPLDLLSRDNKYLRVVMLTGDGLRACMLDGPLPRDVMAWEVQWILPR